MRRALVLGLLLVRCDAPKPPEARLVVEAHEALWEARRGSFEARADRLEALRALALRDPDVASVRDACVSLHATMLEADRLTQEARARVDAFEATLPAERDREETARIAELLGRSHGALRRSEEVRSDCLRGIQRLEEKERR